MKETHFYPQVQLLFRILPLVAEEEKFALKGGTAINCFVRDLPRLSVDIDLTYLPLEDRNTSLKNMSSALQSIAEKIKRAIPDTQIHSSILRGTGAVFKLVIQHQNIQIKIEPNTILRGSVFPAQKRELVKEAQELFKAFTSMQVLSVEDLYGGKLCAALDRQHPRDLFDVKVLFDNEGITDAIRKTFIVYLASHDRPMVELLDPTLKDISYLFENQFSGMTSSQLTLDDLVETRERLLVTLKREMTSEEREFLLSIKQGQPKWSLIDIPDIEKLPAIQWKLQNVRKMSKAKHQQTFEKLKSVLEL